MIQNANYANSFALGRSRIVERAQTLRRALGAADTWGVHKAHREVEKVTGDSTCLHVRPAVLAGMFVL